MSNSLGYYNPVFYAQEALIQLEKSLGMAGRVNRTYEGERGAFGQGEYINIRRPSTFVADNAPSTAQDLTPDSVQVQLSYWREVKFKLTDKELAFTTEKMINDHIRPAAVALADDIDQKIAALYKDVPWFHTIGTVGPVDITTPRQIMFDNQVPLADPGMVHMMINGVLENSFLQLSAFSQQQGAGDAGVNTQMRGSLGTKFGLEIFANQNVPTHTPGTLSDTTIKVNGAHAKGVTSISLNASSLTGTSGIGDSFSIAGQTQRYAITTATAAAGNAVTVGITPPLAVACVGNEAVVVDQEATAVKQNLAFHRDAFALVMAPLPDHAADLGVRVAAVGDPTTGLGLRSRVYYVGNSSEVHVALDVLFGVKTLNPNMAVRARKAT
jgi:P22 coat protein - gene protein 5